MKNSYLRKIAGVTFLTFGLCACGAEITEDLPEENVDMSYVLQAEDYTPSLELSGTIASDQVTNLSTKIGGRIENLNYNTGDRVKAGDVLGNLTSEETSVNANMATQDSAKSQAAYSAQITVLNEQIAQAGESVRTAEISLEEAKNGQLSTSDLLDEQVKLAETNLAQTYIGKENILKIIDQRWLSIRNSVESLMSGTLVLLDSTYALTQDMSDNSDKESFYYLNEDSLGEQNTQTRSNVKDSFLVFEADYHDLHNTVNLGIDFANAPMEDLYLLVKEFEGCLVKAQTNLKNIYAMLQATSAGSKINTTTLNSLRTSVSTFQGNIELALLSSNGGSRSGIRGWLMNYDEIITQNSAELSDIESKIATAEQALSQAKSARNTQNTSLNSQIRLSEQQLVQAKQALATAEAQKRAAEIQYGRDVNASSGTAQLSQIQIENAKIIAPFDGILTGKLAEVGQIVGAGTPIYQLSNDTVMKIEAYVPDKYIYDLQTGQKAQIQIDGLEQEWTATLDKIEPNVNSITRKLKIELVFDAEQDLSQIKLGQFTKINLNLNNLKAYFVPSRFIITDFGGSYIVADGVRQEIDILEQKENKFRINFEGIADGMTLTYKK